jgi:hypothetical protein
MAVCRFAAGNENVKSIYKGNMGVDYDPHALRV